MFLMLVHSEILFQVILKSHYLVLKFQAQTGHSTALLTLGGTILKVYGQSELKDLSVAHGKQWPVAYLKGILCMQISKTPTPQR